LPKIKLVTNRFNRASPAVTLPAPAKLPLEANQLTVAADDFGLGAQGENEDKQCSTGSEYSFLSYSASGCFGRAKRAPFLVGRGHRRFSSHRLPDSRAAQLARITIASHSHSQDAALPTETWTKPVTVLDLRDG